MKRNTKILISKAFVIYHLINGLQECFKFYTYFTEINEILLKFKS